MTLNAPGRLLMAAVTVAVVLPMPVAARAARSLPALVAACDFDRDGYQDVLVVSSDVSVEAVSGRAGTGLWRWRGPSGAARVYPLCGSARSSVLVATVIQAGDSRELRLAHLNAQGQLMWERSDDGTGTSSPAHDALLASPGLLDAAPNQVLLTRYSAATVKYAVAGVQPAAGVVVVDAVAPNSGDVRHSFAIPTTAVGPLIAAVPDVDGDGYRDVVFVSPEPADLRVDAYSAARGQRLWSTSVNMRDGTAGVRIIDVGDIDGDRVRDVGLSGSHAVVLSGRTGTALIDRRGEGLAGALGRGRIGFAGLVTSRGEPTGDRYIGTAGRRVVWTRTFTRNFGPSSALAGDVDGDGVEDLYFTHGRESRVGVLSGTTGSTLSPPGLAPRGTATGTDLDCRRGDDMVLVDGQLVLASSAKRRAVWSTRVPAGVGRLSPRPIVLGDGCSKARLLLTATGPRPAMVALVGRDGRIAWTRSI